MSNLKIIIAPDPRLKQKASLVQEVNKEIHKIMDDMVETMYESKGIGLAATQVGILKNIIVIDINQKKDEDDNLIRGEVLYLINPEITWTSDEINIYEEGCLSLPQQYADVERPAEVEIKYLDYNGEEQELYADDLLATCIQHEIDHLNGIIFVDHISRTKRDMILRKLKKSFG